MCVVVRRTTTNAGSRAIAAFAVVIGGLLDRDANPWLPERWTSPITTRSRNPAAPMEFMADLTTVNSHRRCSTRD